MTTPTPNRGLGERAARLVTEIFAPGVLVVLILLAVGWYSTPGLAGLGWGLLAALFCGIVPYGILIVGARLSWWSDHHVGDRKQRLVPLAIIIAFVSAGIATLALLGAPRPLLTLVITMLTTLVITLAITVIARWKVSVHSLVAVAGAAIGTLLYGAWVAGVVAEVAVPPPAIRLRVAHRQAQALKASPKTLKALRG